MDSNSSADMKSQYALRVALQTLKERCLTLQRRLTNVEEENQQLREHKSDATGQKSNAGGPADYLQLRLQLGELQRQKTQLTEHINMVSNENRKLWSRLSQMAKEQRNEAPTKDNDFTMINGDLDEAVEEEDPSTATSPHTAGCANQNLIRSKTFTQHSPNPHLRHKLIASDTTSDLKDLSLEEVVLDVYESKQKSAGAKYNEATEVATDAALAFAYLNVDDGDTSPPNENEEDFNVEAKKCIDGLQELRREAMKQQQQLNSVYTMLESRIALQPCPECAQKAQKPEMADKSLETDESLNDVKFFNNSQLLTQTAAQNGRNTLSTTAPSSSSTTTPQLNIVQEKIQADTMDKTCPMCGKTYNSLVTFDAFREHVEMHFIDDAASDAETSLDRNYEFISHTVGNF